MRGEGKVSEEKSWLKSNFHLKRRECLWEQIFCELFCRIGTVLICDRTCKDLAQEMSLPEQPIYKSIFFLDKSNFWWQMLGRYLRTHRISIEMELGRINCMSWLVMFTVHGLPSQFTISFFEASGFQKVAARIHISKYMQARNVFKNSIVPKVYYWCFLLRSAQEG